MNKKVAIEKDLSNVKELFTKEGYTVDEIDENQAEKLSGNNYAAIIVSGGSINFLGNNTTSTSSPVINAEGLSAQEIYNMVKH